MSDPCKLFHQRLRRTKGRAANHVCPCGKPAEHWAYQHNGGEHEITLSDGQVYADNFDCYLPMCRSCHNKLDLTHGRREAQLQAARGLAHTPEAIAKMRDGLTGQTRSQEFCAGHRDWWTPERRAAHAARIRAAHAEGRYAK